MLTSFFGKSNPINYLLLAIFIFAAYFLKIFVVGNSIFNDTSLLEKLMLGVLVVFSMLLFDFIIRKNKLTKNNTYGILLFTCFLIAFPVIFLERNIIIANVSLLMGLRRISSFRSDKKIEKKILDAALWITFASLFYFWSLLFFFALYFALVKKVNINYKQLMIPIVGFLGMFVLETAFYFLTINSFDWFFSWKSPIGFDFAAYNYGNLLLPTAVIITFLLWTGLSQLVKVSAMQKKEKTGAIVILVALVTALIIGLASPQKNGAEMLFMMAPLAIIAANYIEKIEEFWFKEVLLWLALLLPIIVFIL